MQRVTGASVTVAGHQVARIDAGLLVLVGATHSDSVREAEALAAKVHGLRVLREERSLADEPAAAALVVSQFTLYGDARKGRRPTWSAAAPGEVAEPLVAAVVDRLRGLGTHVETGIFGADMRVESVNDGPMTVLVEIVGSRR